MRVYFTDPKRGRYGNVTAGETLFEAASNALDWFQSPHWHGPRPTPDTVFDVSAVGDDRVWYVRAGRVMEWREKQNRPDLAATGRLRLTGMD